jgi:hypothetical protein
LRYRVYSLEFVVLGLKFEVRSLGVRVFVRGLKFMISGLGIEDLGLKLRV